MMDLERIGQRIREQRKYMKKVSQEKMAEDLNLYQADISNMEKAKSGSGISDLTKLSMIADYFDIPLETLLFGREDHNMLRYRGDRSQLKQGKRKMTKRHQQTLQMLTGLDEESLPQPVVYECGPYTLYTMTEFQTIMGNGGTSGEDGSAEAGEWGPEFTLPKLHSYIFFDGELVGVMTADYTTLMEHICEPVLAALQNLICPPVLDVTDVLRTLNPYWAHWHFTEEGPEQDELLNRMIRRMEELRDAGKDRPILYIESVYVREDCRQHGIFRMYIDMLKESFSDGILWLNMEPTSGDELWREYDYVPTYTVSGLGQLSINAAIAEKIGFRVDPDTWHRLAETRDADGGFAMETVLVRKCAYYLPAEIRNLLKSDGDLVMQGRAKQKLAMSGEGGGFRDEVYLGRIGEAFACEIRLSGSDEEPVYATVSVRDDQTLRYTVSKGSLFRDRDCELTEEYFELFEARGSEYYCELEAAEEYLEQYAPTSESE